MIVGQDKSMRNHVRKVDLATIIICMNILMENILVELKY